MLWLYLHFPQLQLDHYRASLQEVRPLALVDGHPPEIHSANEEAANLGVQPGQSIHTAQCLAPSLQIRPFDAGLQARILSQLAEWSYERAAPISLCPADGLLLAASGLLRLYGDIHRLWTHLQQGLENQGFQVHLALGTTPLMARLLARAQRGICTDTADPLRQRLAELPVTRTELPDNVCQRLIRMGLHNLAMLQALPTRELARRLGPEAIDHLQRLHGQKPDPQEHWTPPYRLLRRSDFILEVEQVEALRFPLKRMLQLLEDTLLRRQQATDTLLLTLHYRHQGQNRLAVRSAAPEHRAEEFLQLCSLYLERHVLKAPVVALELHVDRFIGRDNHGRDLFGTTDSREEAFNTLCSRLQARLGDKAVHFLQPRDDYRPEKGQSSGLKRPSRPPRSLSSIPSRPFWLMQVPQPLKQPPQQWLDGPERIDAGWWDGEPVKRDYYVVMLADFRMAWVFRDNTGAWYIHGWFT